VRTIGIKRAKVRIGLTNLVYNMIRFGQLLKRDGLRVIVCHQKKDDCGEEVPEMT